MFGLQYNLLQSQLTKHHDMIIQQAESRLELANILTNMLNNLENRIKKLENESRFKESL